MYKSKKSNYVKFLVSSLSLTAVVSLLSSTPVQAKEFSDTESHWAKASIQRWAEFGVIEGYEGQFYPDNNITRGDMAVIVNKIMKYQVVDSNAYGDLPMGLYYSIPVLKLSAANIMTGDTDKNVNPMAFITRQEACVVLCNALHISYDLVTDTGFADDDNIATWAKGAVLAMKELGLVSGKGENHFYPTDHITRGEVTAILNQGITGFYQQAGEYSQDAWGNVVINTPDVTLKNMSIAGDLILAEGVSDGEVYLNNLQISGKIIVKGGGNNSIYMEDVSVTSVHVDRVDGDSRVVMSGDTQVERVTVASLSTVEAVNLSSDGFVTGVVVESGTGCSINGTFDTIAILANDANMLIQGEVTNLSVEGSGGNFLLTDLVTESITCGGSENEIHLLGETSVVAFEFSPLATDSLLNVGEDTVINMVQVSAEGVMVAGEGTVEVVKAEANGTKVETAGTEITVAEGVTGTTAGNVEVDSGSSTTTESSTNNDSSSSNSNSSSSSNSYDYEDDNDDYDDYYDDYDDDNDDYDDFYDDNDYYDDSDVVTYYTVSFALVYDGTSTTTQVESGSTVTAPTTPSRTGYNFAGWTTDINGSNFYSFSNTAITGNLTLYAQWTEIPVVFSLNYSTLELVSGDSSTLVATFSDGSTDDGITWSSSQQSVATVAVSSPNYPETAVVTGLTEGTSIITATTSEGKVASCTVTVTEEKELTGIEKAVAELAAQDNTVTVPSYDGVTEMSLKTALSQIAGMNGVEQVVKSFDVENLTAVIYFQTMFTGIEEETEQSEEITITIVVVHPIVTVVNEAPSAVTSATVALSTQEGIVNSGDEVESNSIITVSISDIPESYTIAVTYKDITNNAVTENMELLETTTGFQGVLNLGSYDTTITLTYTEKELTGIEKAVAELAVQDNTVTVPSYDGVTESSLKTSLSQIAGMNGVEQVVKSFDVENLTAVIYFQTMNADIEEETEQSEEITITIVVVHPIVTVVNEAPSGGTSATMALSTQEGIVNSGDEVESNSEMTVFISDIPEGYTVELTFKDITNNSVTETVNLVENTTGFQGVLNLGSYDTTITLTYTEKELTGIEKAVAELEAQDNTVMVPSYDGVEESSIKSALSSIAGMNRVEQVVKSFDVENLTAVIYFQTMNADIEEETEQSEEITITIVVVHPIVTVVNEATSGGTSATVALSTQDGIVNSGDEVESNSEMTVFISDIPEGYTVELTFKDITNNAVTETVDLEETTTGLQGVFTLGSYDTTMTMTYTEKELTGLEKAVAELAVQDNTVTVPSSDEVTEMSIKSALAQIAGMNQVDQVVKSFDVDTLTAVIYFRENNDDYNEGETTADITITIIHETSVTQAEEQEDNQEEPEENQEEEQEDNQAEDQEGGESEVTLEILPIVPEPEDNVTE